MKKIMINDLLELKKKAEPITALGIYDACFTKIANQVGIEVLVVGDSLGMSICGLDTTIPVGIDAVAYHTNAVAKASSSSLVIGDLPYMTYATKNKAIDNSVKLMQAGSHMVKLEGGGEWIHEIVTFLTERGIPVCGHLGLTPQYYLQMGGFKVQGKNKESAKIIFESAKKLEKSGIQLLILECIPEDLAKNISKSLSIPVIGIGAGRYTDGQVLVVYDIIGISGRKLKFAKDYLSEVNSVSGAIEKYYQEVKGKQFPTQINSFE